MKCCNKKSSKFHLPFLFGGIIFIIMLTAMCFVFMFLFVTNSFDLFQEQLHRLPIFFFALVSLAFGTLIAIFFSKYPLSPLREVMRASDKIASGDYSTRIDLRGIDEFDNLTESFNHMASELESVELLRKDFINNLSHEFKTPIVSIKGFAKLMLNDEISQEEKKQYLNIIISESERLVDMSTKILDLSKIEKQIILTDIKQYNITEQLRLIVVLLEQQWSLKELNIEFECDEYYIEGNIELIQQVFINVIDNAIKYSPLKGTLKINLYQDQDSVYIKCSDQGIGIKDEDKLKIFNKFYQGDKLDGHSGNGVGLAIADIVIKLHQGSIIVKDAMPTGSTFVVQLPRFQG